MATLNITAPVSENKRAIVSGQRYGRIPRPSLHPIRQRLVGFTAAPATKTVGATGRRPGETREQMRARRKAQREVA